MPRSTREWARRELEASVKNIDWSGSHLYAVIEKYESEHPQVSEPLVAILKVFEECQTMINLVRSSF